MSKQYEIKTAEKVRRSYLVEGMEGGLIDANHPHFDVTFHTYVKDNLTSLVNEDGETYLVTDTKIGKSWHMRGSEWYKLNE